ncbi:hypothetical protein E2320_006796, partial [Naja naja]
MGRESLPGELTGGEEERLKSRQGSQGVGRVHGSTEAERSPWHPDKSLPALTLLGDLEVLLAAQNHGLQHLMGGDVGLEVPGVPQLPHELPKPLDQQEHDVPWGAPDVLVVLLLQK